MVSEMSVPSYWRESKYRYRLIGSVCLSCGRRFYPPRKVCPVCHSHEMQEIKLPERGRIVSYTIIHYPPEGYEKCAPYAVAVIELSDGTRVLGQLTDVDISEVKTGMEVEAVFRRITEEGKDGIIEYGIKFRPVLRTSSQEAESLRR